MIMNLFFSIETKNDPTNIPNILLHIEDLIISDIYCV